MDTKDTDDQNDAARKRPEYEVPRYGLSHAIARLGGSTSAHTIKIYVRDGLLKPFRDSQGRMLLSDKDLDQIQQIREMRASKWGRSVRHVTSTYTG
jgi:hypothetical protein